MGQLYKLIAKIKQLFSRENLVRFVKVPRRIDNVKHYHIRDGFQ